MNDVSEFKDISPTTLADLLGRGQVMDIGIRPLRPSVPRVAGPAFTVRCPPGDNLMLHAAHPSRGARHRHRRGVG